MAEIEEMPYGRDAHGKTIPFSVYHYEKAVKELIKNLVNLYDIDKNAISIHSIDAIRSILKNDVRHLIVDNKRKTNLQSGFYCDDEMEIISTMIKLQILNVLND